MRASWIAFLSCLSTFLEIGSGVAEAEAEGLGVGREFFALAAIDPLSTRLAATVMATRVFEIFMMTFLVGFATRQSWRIESKKFV